MGVPAMPQAAARGDQAASRAGPDQSGGAGDRARGIARPAAADIRGEGHAERRYTSRASRSWQQFQGANRGPGAAINRIMVVGNFSYRMYSAFRLMEDTVATGRRDDER